MMGGVVSMLPKLTVTVYNSDVSFFKTTTERKMKEASGNATAKIAKSRFKNCYVQNHVLSAITDYT
jgi:hypothetical protein